MDGTALEPLEKMAAGQNGGLEYAWLPRRTAELLLVGSNGFMPTDGAVFDIANAGSISGAFSDDILAYPGGSFTVSSAASGCAAAYADCLDLTWRAGSPSSVPEPSNLALLMLGVLSLAWRAGWRLVRDSRAGFERLRNIPMA